MLDGQDTPFSPLKVALLGLSSPTHATVPFQFSVIVSKTPVLLRSVPAAAHTVLVVQDTPVRLFCVAPLGLAEVWIAQLDPFQLSSSVTPFPML